MKNEIEIRSLYRQLMEGAWNKRDALGFAAFFSEDGESIGFDGSQSIGRAEIYQHLNSIFEHHITAQFITKVKSVRFPARKLMGIDHA